MLRDYPPFNSAAVPALVEQIIRLRRSDQQDVQKLHDSKLGGRQRTGVRSVPTAANDVAAGDVVGDVITDGTYRYTLVTVVGTGLRWHRETLSVGW